MPVVVPMVVAPVKGLRVATVRAGRVDVILTGLLPADVAVMRVVRPKAVAQVPVVPVGVVVKVAVPKDVAPKGVVPKDARVLMDLRHITRNDSSNTRWSSTRTKTASSAKRSC